MAKTKIKDKEVELITKWMARFKDSEAYTQDFFDAGKKNYKNYKSYQESSDKIYSHNIFVPYSFAYLEDYTAYFMLSLLASPVIYSLSPRFRAISPELCRQLEVILDFFVSDEKTEFILETEEMIKNCALYNVGYLVNYPVVSDNGKELVSITLDCPYSLNVFPEPHTKRFSRSSWVIKRSWESLDNIKALAEGGTYSKEAVSRIQPGSMREGDPVTEALNNIGLSTKDGALSSNPEIVEILDCLSGGDVVTIAGRTAVIKDTTKDNVRPFLNDFPMLDCRLTGAPSEFFGTDLLESMKDTQKDLNDLRSQRRDNLSLILNKVFLYDLMAGEVDLDTVFSAPGNIIVQQGKALEEMQTSDVTGSSYKEEEQLLYDLQSITNLWAYSRGAPPRRRETATGIIRLQQAAQGRMEWLIRKLDFYIFQPFARRTLIAVREFMSVKMYNEIIGMTGADGSPNKAEEFFSIPLDKISRSFQIQPMTESISSVKEVDTNQFLQAFDRLIQLPDVNRPALIKQLLIKLGQKDLKSVLPQLTGGAQDAIASTADAGVDPAAMGLANMPKGGGQQ